MAYRVKMRDRVAWNLSTWALNTFASKEYHAYLYLLVKFGRERFEEELAKEESQ